MNFIKTTITAGAFLLSAFCFQNFAFAQYQPNFYRSDTNAFPLTLTNGQATTFTGTNSLKLTVRQKTGLSVFATAVSTNTSGTTEAIGFDLTYDGTNGTTRQPLTFYVPGNYSGTNTWWTNWSSEALNNVRSIQATTATNNTPGIPGSNSIVITKLVYSWNNQ